MHTTLGKAGAAGAIEPEGAVVFAGLRCFQAARRGIDPLFKVMLDEHCGRRCTRRNSSGPCRGCSDDDEVAQVLQFRKDWLNLLPDRGMDKEDTRAAVIEHIDVVPGT